MGKTTKKRGQKLSKRFVRISRKAEKSSSAHIRENFINRISHIKNVRLLVLEWFLLVAAITVLAIAQSFLYRGSYATEGFTSGGTYTEATIGEVDSLNPLFANTNSERVLSKLMFATLTADDTSGHSGPALAGQIRAEENGKVWKIKLRDHLQWSDGQPLTNEDILFTVKLIQNPVVNSVYASNLSSVTVEEVEDGWLSFTLPAAYANFSSALNIPVLPQHILQNVEPAKLQESDYNMNPVTSGAFTFNASQANKSTTANSTYYLKSNPSYYLGQPLIDTFAVSTFSNTDDIIKALNDGSVTATAELQPSDADKVTNHDIYQKQTSLHSGVYAFINTSSEVLGNIQLRQAIRQGINIDEIRADLADEQALDYPLLDSQLKLNYPALPAHDFEAAHQAVTTAEFNRESPIQIATVSTGNLPAVTNKLADQLRTLGFQADVTVYEPDQDFLVNVIRSRSYDILVYEVELGADPDLFAYYHSSQARGSGLNLSNYRKAITDDLLLAARTTLDDNLRSAKYESFLRSWVNDVPAIGIYQSNLTYYFNKTTENFSEDNRLVVPTDRFADVRYWSAVMTLRNRTP